MKLYFSQRSAYLSPCLPLIYSAPFAALPLPCPVPRTDNSEEAFRCGQGCYCCHFPRLAIGAWQELVKAVASGKDSQGGVATAAG